MESPVKGIFPCGEERGYAGGITSAAMDGIKTAEEIIRRYSPLRPSRTVAKHDRNIYNIEIDVTCKLV